MGRQSVLIINELENVVRIKKMKEAPIPKNEKGRLADVIALNLTNFDKAEHFDRIVLIVSKYFNVPIAYFSSIESKKQIIHSSCGIGDITSDRSSSF